MVSFVYRKYNVFSKCESAHLCINVEQKHRTKTLIAFPDTLILETMVKLVHVIYTAMTLFYDKLN